MKIKEGDKIPNSEFYYLDENGAPKKISTSELFNNSKTIVDDIIFTYISCKLFLLSVDFHLSQSFIER